jgi:hypothetical protein
MLDMSKISSSIKKYGEKLYEETQSFGTVTLEEADLVSNQYGDSLDLRNGYFAQIKRGLVYDASYTFTICECVALRDATITVDGETITIAKGKTILIAR